MPRTARPPRLPVVLLEALFPSPQLLTGRLAASTVAMYTRDCAAYVAFCGYDGVLAVQAETLRRWRTYLVEDTRLSPHTINRMLAAVKRVIKEARAGDRRAGRGRSVCRGRGRQCGGAAASPQGDGAGAPDAGTDAPALRGPCPLHPAGAAGSGVAGNTGGLGVPDLRANSANTSFPPVVT